jgi:hypothetical protein
MKARLERRYLSETGWLESAEAKLAIWNGRAVPWFTYPALRFLEKELTPDLALFEYGGGQSTIYWHEKLRYVATVEHDPDFVDHIRQSVPEGSELHLIGEGEELSEKQQRWSGLAPHIDDPQRSQRAFRSGQLNSVFQAYALKLLEYEQETFDVVVVDGMARVLSTWAAIQHFDRGGFIVFDNSDRDFYSQAYGMLESAGYRRIDFWGLGPVNPYEWCTSVFYRHAGFNGAHWFPRSAAKCHEQTRERSDELGILVIGYNRPYHLQSVLESLRLQGRIGSVHVWIDGTQGRGEYLGANDKSVEIAGRYQVRELRATRSHLGIEKMMLDAMDTMSREYDRVLVLEDDCFPLEGAVERFEEELSAIKSRNDVFSVYGHHFLVEKENEPDFPRFQGWGWAAHSKQVRRFLPKLKQLFSMSENEYTNYVRSALNDDIRGRLDTTPGRNVLQVLETFFSWDSATAFLTAAEGMLHRRTPVPAVVNTGIVPGIGHFRNDTGHTRKPPFNMITLDEAWEHYDTTTEPCQYVDQTDEGRQLDLLVREVLPDTSGFFVEVGASDCVTRSKSLFLEASGWHGILIVAAPAAYAKCVRARSRAIVEHAACAPRDSEDDYLLIPDNTLNQEISRIESPVEYRDVVPEGEAALIDAGSHVVEVPAATLSEILDKHCTEDVDLLLLNADVAQLEVLDGLDFDRHAPRYIIAEDAHCDDVYHLLLKSGYERTQILLEKKLTRDCLYRRLT